MTSVKVSPNVVENGLGEIYQSMSTKMALLTRQSPLEFTRITPFVQCRDFLVDVYTFIRAGKTEFSEGDIYGMTLPKDSPAEDGAYLQLIFPSPAAQACFEKQLPFLHAIEKANNYKVTELLLGGVLVGDKQWLTNCLSWSLYTSLVRCLCYDFGEEQDWIKAMATKHKGSTDGKLVASVAGEVWINVLCDLALLTAEDYVIHHNSGFYSVFGTHRELSKKEIKNNKHWKHFKELGWPLHTK